MTEKINILGLSAAARNLCLMTTDFLGTSRKNLTSEYNASPILKYSSVQMSKLINKIRKY